MSWVAPAVGIGVVLGGLALVRHFTLKPKPGDHVAIPVSAIQARIGLPPDLVPPGTANVLLLLDPSPQDAFVTGSLVGYVDAAGNPVLPLGGAGGLPMLGGFPRQSVVAIFRGTPLRRVS